jgi:hypothetical protein
MRLIHSVFTLGQSLRQLVYGTAMAIHARQLKLAWRYTHGRVISCPRNEDMKAGTSRKVPAYHYTPPPAAATEAL